MEDMLMELVGIRENNDGKYKGRNCEYALRCDLNAKKGKSRDLWNELKKV